MTWECSDEIQASTTWDFASKWHHSSYELLIMIVGSKSQEWPPSIAQWMPLIALTCYYFICKTKVRWHIFVLLVSDKKKSNDIQMQTMMGDQESLAKRWPTHREGGKVHNDPWGNAMMWYDAMRDLRDKIGVSQMPLFKVILAGEVKFRNLHLDVVEWA